MAVARLAPQHVQMQHMLDHVFEQGLLLGRVKLRQALRVEAQGGDAVAKGHPEGLVPRHLAAAKAEQELAVEGMRLEQTHHGVFKDAFRHGSGGLAADFADRIQNHRIILVLAEGLGHPWNLEQ